MRQTRLRRLLDIKKRKKTLAWVLVSIILISMAPWQPDYALTPSTAQIDAIMVLQAAEGGNLPRDVVTQMTSTVLNGPEPLVVRIDTTDYWFNVFVYNEYHLITYGKRFGTKDPVSGEYRYLGYDKLQVPVTNDRFPNDATGSNPDYTMKNWVTASGAKESWRNKVQYTPQQERIMRYKPIIDNGSSYPNNLEYILQKRIDMGAANDEARKPYMLVQVAPSLRSNGSIRLMHKNLTTNEEWYNTFIVPKFDFNPTVTVTPMDQSNVTISNFTMQPTDTQLTIKVKVTANLNMPSDLGMTPSEAINYISLDYNNNVQIVSVQDGTATYTYAKTFNRSELQEGKVNSIQLKGYIHKMTSVLKDEWYNIEGDSSINIDVKPTTTPNLTATATANPDSVQFNNSDIPVVVTVKGTVTGFNMADFSKWTLYARKDEDATALQSNVTASVTTATANFNFTIPKALVTNDSYTQGFTSRARLYRKDGTYIDAAAVCSTYIYKEAPLPPPIPGNLPPNARLSIPPQVKAGDDVFFDGSASYDLDGYIEEYIWTTPGTNDIIDGDSGVSWYPAAGSYSVKLKVKDDDGAYDSASKSITVLPPTPDAKLKYTGTLKENRKFTLIDDGSTSPKHYPIIAEDIKFAITGGSPINIKNSGSLTGVSSVDFLIKAANTYTGSIYVDNTAGCNDTEYTALKIAPDLPPVADFTIVNTVLRDINDSDYATITVNDNSYSSDYDLIGNLIYQLYYDSDNNGSYDNGYAAIDLSQYADGETKSITAPWGETILAIAHKPAGKSWSVDIKTKSVGDYKIECTAVESFGQETIPELITEEDYRKDDTSDLPLLDKYVEVINLAPYTGFGMVEKRKVDLQIGVANTSVSYLNTLNTKINSILKPILAEQNIDANITAASALVSTGSIPINKFYYEDYDDHRIKTFDPITEVETTLYAGNVRYLTVSPDGKLYYQDYNDSNKRLGVFNPETKLAATLSSYGTNVRNISLSPDGRIVYYICTVSAVSYLYAYDTKTSTNTRLDSIRVAYAAIAPDGKLYYGKKLSSDDDYYKLMCYDPKTGSTTTIAKVLQLAGNITVAANGMLVFSSGTNTLGTYDPAANVYAGYSKVGTYAFSNLPIPGPAMGNKVYFNCEITDGTPYLFYFDTSTKTGGAVSSYEDVRALTNYGDLFMWRVGYGLHLYGSNEYFTGIEPVGTNYPLIEIPQIIPNELNSLLPSLAWRQNAEKYYVTVNNNTLPELNDDQKLGSILQNMLSENTCFIGMGTAANKAQLETFIAQNDNNGIYIDNSNLDTALARLGDYVVNKVNLDLTINLGDSIYTQNSINDKINSIVKPKLIDNNICPNIIVEEGRDTSHAVKTTAAGWNHTLALKNDSTLWAYGNNSSGQLGDGTTTNSLVPKQIMTDVKAISAGWNYSMAIKNDGTLWTWGYNSYGQLGDGTTSNSLVPKQILTGVKAISAGSCHALAIRNDGTLWAWGYNSFGQLGDGTTTNSKVPKQIMTEIESISAGEKHSSAVKYDSTLWTWGYNSSGQLGNNTTTNSKIPKQIMTDAKIVTAGWNHTLAIKNDGTLWAWGDNSSGQLGDGTTSDRDVPQQILIDNVVTISAGAYHTLALKNDGALWAWGGNSDGQLGDGTTIRSKIPKQIVNGIESISAGLHCTLAIKDNNTLWAWGDNGDGQFGDGTTTDSLVPKQNTEIESCTIIELNSTLSAKQWDPTNDHMYVDVQDYIRPELNDSAKLQAVLDNIRQNDIKLIGLGTLTNVAQYNDIVNKSGCGTFIENTNLNTAMNALADYIIANIKRSNLVVYNYALLGDTVNYNTVYDDPEADPMYAERWKYTHNETYFDNNLGCIPDSGQYRETPYLTFDKVGKFDITYSARDNPKDNDNFDEFRLWSNEELSTQTIFVHRKPNAIFTSGVRYDSAASKYYAAISEASEDIDHTSRTDKGIVQKKWRWKLSTDTEWTNGQVTEMVKGNVYLQELMVQDMEGAWSDPLVLAVEVPDILVDAAPTMRDWANTDVTAAVTAVLTSGSFSKTNYKWTNDTMKPTSGWTSNTNLSFTTTQSNNGEWYLHMEAFNTLGVSYYIYRGPYRIDKLPPTITADINSVDSMQPVTVNADVLDTGGSGLKAVNYEWSTSSTKPTSGWIDAGTGGFSTIQDQEGQWYLHVQAWDNAGNYTYKVFGAYKISSLMLKDFRVVMVRDIKLDTYYANLPHNYPQYIDKPMYANDLAIDWYNFNTVPGFTGLTKGYRFEFEIDSKGFNEAADTIVITPTFYGFTQGAPMVRGPQIDLYWENSSHQILKAGTGGHSAWNTVTLTSSNRTIQSDTDATWRGYYLIPGTAFPVTLGTDSAAAEKQYWAKSFPKYDILVNFTIKGYKAGVEKFDYNTQQWGNERTAIPWYKEEYEIGDVILYEWDKSNLDDITTIRKW